MSGALELDAALKKRSDNTVGSFGLVLPSADDTRYMVSSYVPSPISDHTRSVQFIGLSDVFCIGVSRNS